MSSPQHKTHNAHTNDPHRNGGNEKLFHRIRRNEKDKREREKPHEKKTRSAESRKEWIEKRVGSITCEKKNNFSDPLQPNNNQDRKKCEGKQAERSQKKSKQAKCKHTHTQHKTRATQKAHTFLSHSLFQTACFIHSFVCCACAYSVEYIFSWFDGEKKGSAQARTTSNRIQTSRRSMNTAV